MNRIRLIAIFGLVTLIGAPAIAHHSFAMFDGGKEVSLAGSVKEFQWTNPHSWIQILVPDANGKVTEWSIEGGSPNALGRHGWRASTLKPGDKATVKIHPLKDGTPGGSLISVTLSDGRVIGER